MLLTCLAIVIGMSWIAMIILASVFLFKFLKTEYREQIFLIAIMTAFVVCGNFVPSMRGGYDNNHDFESLYLSVGNNNSKCLYFNKIEYQCLYKEISPVLINNLVNTISSRNLNAILIFNRILPLLSLLIFYAGLRKVGAGKTGSIVGTCILFFNFQALISASSFSTTSIAVFIFITAIASLLNAISKEKIGTADLIFILSSTILTAMSRIEHLPALAIIAIFLIFSKAGQKDTFLYKKHNIVLFCMGLICLALCIMFQFSFAPHELLQKPRPFLSFNMHFIKENLAIMMSNAPANAFPEHLYRIGLGSIALAAFLLLALLPSSNISWRKIPKVPALIAVIFAYFMCIYHWQDQYPLHFARHRMFMMIPMSALAAFSVKNIICLISDKFPRQKTTAITAVSLAIILYAMTNIKTAYALNDSLRNNDIEWQLLVNAQKEIKGKYKIITSNKYNRDTIISYYFGFPKETTAPALYYISTDMITFSKEPNAYNSKINKIYSPFRIKKFYNSFHTTSKEESHDKILLSPGFYKDIKDNPLVRKKIMEGLICIMKGDYQCAISKAIELENHDISRDAHFFKFLAYTVGKNDSGIESELKFFVDNLQSKYNIRGLQTAKVQLINNPELLPNITKNTISSDPITSLDKIWNIISYELDESSSI